jgi:heat shock protein HtpX
MPAPLADAARRSKRRLVLLTSFACFALGTLLSVFGTFFVWAWSSLLWHEAPVPVLVGAGVALGLALASALVWAAVGHAAGRVHDQLGPLVIDPADRRWRRAAGLMEPLAIAVGVPSPRVWIVRLDAPNALAVGVRPESTEVYITTGLMDLLTRDEVEAVLASVVASIGRFDVALGTVGYAVGDGLVDLAGISHGWDPRGWPITVALAPFGLTGWLTKALVLRWRGEGSDAAGMAFTRYPPALYTALLKLQRDTRGVGTVPISTRHLWYEYPDHEVSGNSYGSRQRPPSLGRRVLQVASALRAVDPSWEPPESPT